MDPRKSADQLASELAALSPELQDLIATDPAYEAVRVTLNREQAFPIDPATAHVIVTLAAKGIVSGVLSKIGQDIYEFLKKRIRGGKVDPTGG
jgi:hypothetical protein